MTKEEVYKGLEQADAYFRSSFDAMYGTFACEKFRSWVDAIEHALALLKEQEPRTALNIIKVHEGTLGNCPTCGAELIDYYNETHCGRCGQAVKWNG